MPTARAAPNIALIKYWGNRNDVLRLPAADSLSMTLDGPTVDVTVEPSDVFAVRSDRPLSQNDEARFAKVIDLARPFLAELGAADALPAAVAVTVDSHIPAGIGLASSAAVFAAYAKALAGLVAPVIALDERQTSILARLGSGSAARSIFGGFAAFINEAASSSAMTSAFATPIADEQHWPLHDIVIAPSTEHKKTGSTEGHARAATSPKFAERIRNMPRRMEECTAAIRDRDFEKLRAVSEEDCLDMHGVMQTQDPPLQYLNATTLRLVDEIRDLRARGHLPVLFTMDAGPTVHLVCEEEAVNRIRAYAKAQNGCTVFEAKAGPGALLL